MTTTRHCEGARHSATELIGRRFQVHDRLHWRGHPVEVVDVALLAPGHQQVLIRLLDDDAALPLSMPAAEVEIGLT